MFKTKYEITLEIAKILKSYVYVYIDPRNGKPFYIGKGIGNRPFAHLKDQSDIEKVAQIAEIRRNGKETAATVRTQRHLHWLCPMLQKIVDQYNSGASATEVNFEDLMNFTKDLNEEERHIREGLTGKRHQ